MKRKAQIAATLPEYVTEAIVHYGRQLELTKSEYLALIAKKWFADGCPPISAEEQALRSLVRYSGANQPGTTKITLKHPKP